MARARLEDRVGRVPVQVAAGLLQPAEETAPAPGMASDTPHGLDAQQDGVAIAVQAYLAHALHVARRLALAPECLARARPVHRLAQRHGALERLAVHPRDHEHL